MTLRFIHASDLHLGRRFANIPQSEDGNVRGRLMEARHGAIGRIAAAARDHGAAHVLLAGDTFDTATPSPSVLRQALAAMGDAPEVTWWLLPGNHDNLRDAEPLWESVARDAPGNVRPLVEATAVELGPDATLLPCPVAWRSSGVDPTDALAAMPSPDSAARIAIAHGGVTDFDESGATIPPDRDRSAGLDYLALGDWHGRLAIGPRVHYPGTPEQDRFKHGRRGVCLAVTIDGRDAEPRVAEVETGAFLWTEAEVMLTPRQEAAAALRAILPGTGRRDLLLRVRVAGWAGLAQRAALEEAAAGAAPDFAHFELDTRTLGTEYGSADLDEIDREGALRLAAERLRDAAASETTSEADRAVAGDALARLYAYVKEAAR